MFQETIGLRSQGGEETFGRRFRRGQETGADQGRFRRGRETGADQTGTGTADGASPRLFSLLF